MKTAPVRKKLIFSVISLTLSLAVFVMAAATYAWFTTVWRGERKLTAKTGEGAFPPLHAWIFDVDNEESGETILKKGTWKNALGNGTDNPNYSIKGISEGNGVGNSEKFTFKTLHLGTVDNLLQASSDNYFYLCFDVTNIEQMGKKVRAKYSVTKNDIKLYDLDGYEHNISQTSSDEHYEEVDYSLFVDVFQIELAVSTVYYDLAADTAENTANATAVAALFTSGNTDGYVKLTNNNNNNANFADVFTTDKTSAYYLYVRLSPNLENCMTATEAIATLMPCELVFDINFEIEFYEIYEGATSSSEVTP
ncbi:MAG: hypothetical protein IJU84_04735 [Clostridia bacterium]|nr:hypothetical protein [Clostridia bacterium]